ncbi:MAG TPA: amino acid ABC transporter permease [Stellaceae bacterium]|nr:amino acid ABC transporter permease [Stellaceae bacterium]
MVTTEDDLAERAARTPPADPDAAMQGLTSTAPVPLRHPGRWVACTAVLLLLAWFAYVVSTNPNFQWPVVGKYLFNPEILQGVLLTIRLTISCMCIGIALGIVVALMRLSENKLLAYSAQVYIVAFRGTPALVQLIFWFNLSALFPVIAIGLPFLGLDFVTVDANALITPVVAANLGLGLCEGAYMAEIVRSGILSVDPGQQEAAAAVGMTRAQTMRKVILPQALRVIIPPTGNQIIGMLKYTSLASVISVTELLSSAELIYTRTYETIPLLIVASLWYLLLTTLLTAGQRILERWVGRSQTDTREKRRAPFGLAVMQNLFTLRSSGTPGGA